MIAALVASDASWAERVGWALMHSFWQCSLLATLLAFVLRMLRRSSAQARYVAACLTLFAMFVALVGTVLVVEVPNSRIEPATTAATVEPQPSRLTSAPDISAFSSLKIGALVGFVSTKIGDWVRWAPSSLTAVWSIGVAILTVRLLAAWVRVRSWNRGQTRPLDRRWDDALLSLTRRMNVTRGVELLESSLAQVPLVVGWLRPVILVPASMVSGMAPEQVEAILAHELAHIRRHDYLINLVQSVLEVVLFYHPATHWVSRVIREEREHCCDDAAVTSCGNRLIYAKALAALEELRGEGWALSQAATGSPLLARIRRILGKGDLSMRSSLSVSSLAIVLLAGAALAVAAPPKQEKPPAAEPSKSSDNSGAASLKGEILFLLDTTYCPTSVLEDALTTMSEPKSGDAPANAVPASSGPVSLLFSANVVEKEPVNLQFEAVAKDAPLGDRVVAASRDGLQVADKPESFFLEFTAPKETEPRRENVRFILEKIGDKVDAPRVYPLMGLCELVHEHYKCTIYFDERKGDRVVPRVEVSYVEKDRLRAPTAKNDTPSDTKKRIERRLGELIQELEKLKQDLRKD